jgi:hypothetical protein
MTARETDPGAVEPACRERVQDSAAVDRSRFRNGPSLTSISR